MFRLLDNESLSTCGIVMGEILQGALDENEYQELSENLSGLIFLEANVSVYHGAGRLSYELRKKGRSIPLTDAIIATLAIRHGQTLWTRDAHFRGIPGLKLK